LTTAATETAATTAPAAPPAPAAAPAAAPAPGGPVPRFGRHIPALDGVRGIAILLVLYQHFVPTVFPRMPAFGWTGVDLFFVLSGFLITGILYDAKGGKSFFKNFYMRRVLRIFPLYYGVLVAVLVLIPFAIEHVGPIHRAVLGRRAAALDELLLLRGRQGWLWLYGQNFAIGLLNKHFYPLDHLWSLAVEEHFYLVWPFLVYLCSRRAAIGVCVGVILTALALRLTALATGSRIDIYVLTPCRMDALAIGALLALLVRGPRGIGPLVRPAAVVALTVAAAVVVYIIKTGNLEERMDPVVLGPGFTIIGLMFGGFLVLSLAADPRRFAGRAVAHPALRFLGRYSYALYVFHWPILVAMGAALPFVRVKERFGAAGGIAYIVVAAVLSVGVAFASWHLYEKHWLRLKRFFDYRKPVDPADLNAP
jgi:peptidoglycan/LPS O-acetylase OafA/YrhL